MEMTMFIDLITISSLTISGCVILFLFFKLYILPYESWDCLVFLPEYSNLDFNLMVS